ncbi:uncharacterized protein RCC_01387 [Ramularia collo-cygni]|uniref:Uncharacterized protein n=1 Tax=Ramularia collo-cygni TaxID=112498 RepID=A0A2D3ULU5_9PEZI|nr:uncharacterized protein RCC_01387 [Ramularia collo-cygni]CZT15532.1 uncharacterized protein RCC_01387 [Ramularia collo-cygni]
MKFSRVFKLRAKSKAASQFSLINRYMQPTENGELVDSVEMPPISSRRHCSRPWSDLLPVRLPLSTRTV